MTGYSLRRLIARLEMEKSLGVEYLTLPEGVESLCARLRSGSKEQVPAAKTLKAKPADAGMRDGKAVGAAIRGKSGAAETGTAARNSASQTSPELPADNSAPLPVGTSSPSLPPGYISLVPYREPPPRLDRAALLEDLRQECLNCEKCVLCRRRTRVAWGEGDLAAEVMFIGEGPGRDEDLEGRPFVGRSGRLLTDIIEKGMKISRSEVYITNVVKCRPPGNRDPKPEETAACAVYLDRQIEVISPKVLVAVGGVATRTLLQLPPDASRLRGRWFEYRGIPLRSIYHPSFLLRQRRNDGDRTEADRLTWQDVQAVLAKLGS